MNITPLKIARMKKGIPQWKFAQMIGIDRTVLSYYETGRRRPPFDIRYLIACKLDESVESLFPEEQ